MKLRQWMLGCLNSGLKQGAKLALVVVTSYITGTKLDVATLVVAYSVGFLWGVLEYQFTTPIPDLDAGDVIVPPASTTKQPDKLYS